MLCPPGVACEGAVITYFAKAVSGAFPSIDASRGAGTPAFSGDPEQFLAAHGGTEEIRRFLLNTVKKCSGCSKPNAFILESCNSCGKSLRDVPLSHSFNCFMGFVFGIERGPFPYTISLRYEDENVIVIDDLLALAPMHLNVIPTSHYIPDWRYLLRRPTEGLAVVNMMMEKCNFVAKRQFLSNEAFVSKYFNPNTFKDFDIETDIASGFNYPPSQYQLHIQYILPVLTPFHFGQYLKGVHYTQRRFFPVPYVKQCLELAAQTPVPPEILSPDVSIDCVINYFRSKHSLDYDVLHAEFYTGFRVKQQKFANWKQEDFEGFIVEYGGREALFLDAKTKAIVSSIVPAQVVTADKATIMSYGRPYSAEGKPTGTYYSYAKQPKDIIPW